MNMNYTITVAILLAASVAVAQDTPPDPPLGKHIASIDIRTSTVCDMCEKTIEENLIYERGVKKVDVDLEKSRIHVEYDQRKISPEVLRIAVSKLGYMADDIPGDENAFKKLPACCQKEGCGKPVE